MFIVQSISNKSIATKKVVLRTIKLFILGLVLQGMLFFLSFGSFMTMSYVARSIGTSVFCYNWMESSEIDRVCKLPKGKNIAFVPKVCMKWSSFFIAKL